MIVEDQPRHEVAKRLNFPEGHVKSLADLLLIQQGIQPSIHQHRQIAVCDLIGTQGVRVRKHLGLIAALFLHGHALAIQPSLRIVAHEFRNVPPRHGFRDPL